MAGYAKRPYCESGHCKWQGEYEPMMLEIDHKDGDRDNNDLSNLWTLCANCHAFKTRINGDHLPKSKRVPLNQQRYWRHHATHSPQEARRERIIARVRAQSV